MKRRPRAGQRAVCLLTAFILPAGLLAGCSVGLSAAPRLPERTAAVTTAPVTTAPVTDAPVTDAPVTTAPVTTAPVTTAPVTTAPITTAPVTDAPLERIGGPLSFGRGEIASVTVQGVPGVEYTITVWYSSGKSSAKGLEPKAAGSDGRVSWSWKIGPNTKPSESYRITVSGGGQTANFSFSVV